MAVDTPARIAILGAGPIGLEAALYARYLGYDVDVYERGGVAENVLRWGHVRMFSPFEMNRSPLGLAALHAQDGNWAPPSPDSLLTGREFAERYLIPLSKSDLLVDGLHENTEVLAIGREGLHKADLVGDESRGDGLFRILVRKTDPDGRVEEHIHQADIAIDASGTLSSHNWLGAGGIPAPGELELESEIEYGIPEVLGRERHRYAGMHTLIVGRGYSAATTACALADLANRAPGTRITWIARRREGRADFPPIRPIPHDRLAERSALAARANELAADINGPVRYWPGITIDAVDRDPAKGLHVRLLGEHAGLLEVDHIVANVGYRPDDRLYAELQVHQCYASGAPMRLASALVADHAPADCLDQRPGPAESLLNPEPNFYILGAKSYGRDSRFLISLGITQVRDLFTIIADRANLDLYATMGPLCK